MKLHFRALICAAAVASLPGLSNAEVRVGVTVGTTGPAASLGIPYRNAFDILPDTLGGEPVRYIILDDASDPTNATRNARRLIEEDKVDILLGSGTTPSSTAVSEVAGQFKVPQIALSPVAPAAMQSNPWTFSVAQPVSVMMGSVVDHIKKNGGNTIGYIGFADSWGDLVLSGTSANTDKNSMEVVANERYGRVDTSVAGQVLKLMSARPDAVVVGGSGTPGAMPHVALRDRGYEGPIYHNHGVINRDFLRVGGKALEGGFAPTGPVMVAEQLPDDNPIKAVALKFSKDYEAKFGEGSRNAFSAYTYDAYLLADAAVAEAKKKAEPGTPEFRAAVRDALENTKELVGTHGVYNMTPTDHIGVDQRAAVLVRITDGDWELVKD
ncbi:MAG: ABC transporter substrate-binding protein [Pigmentiphaga sp.]